MEALIKNIDYDDHNALNHLDLHKSGASQNKLVRKIKEINKLGNQIILKNPNSNTKEKAYSENGEIDCFYDIDDQYFSDCNISGIANMNN